MKYCPKCKLRAPDDGTACVKCGGDLRGIGGSTPAGAAGTAGGEPAELALRLQGLQHEVQRSRRSVTLLAIAAGSLGLLFVGLLVWLYLHDVFQYARVESVRFNPLAKPGAVEIIYSTDSGGKVEFTRKNAARTETLTDFAPPASPQRPPERRFVWAGDPSGQDTIQVRYRSGLKLTTERWTAQ